MKHWIEITTTDGAVVTSKITEGGAEDFAVAMTQILDEGDGAFRVETGDDVWVVLRPSDVARVKVFGIGEEVNR